jgi:hypothetical protein
LNFCIFVVACFFVLKKKKPPIEAVLFHLVGSYLFPSRVPFLIGILSSFVLST